MSLKFIFGNSGSGKSYQAYQEIIRESMEHPERNFLVIVPEQFTMQTQKELVTMHPRKGILNIDVLSFQRLAYRVFEEVGADKRSVLEETGKSLLLRKAAMEHREELKVLGSNLEKPGYIARVKSMISELTQYDVSQEQMEEMLSFSEDKPQLYYKLRDVQVLYRAFREKLREKYITAEEVLSVLCQVVDQSELLKDSVLLLDEFTGFTPIQQRLVFELLKCCRRVSIALTIDAGEDPFQVRGIHQLFYLTKKTVHTLTRIARETGTEIEEPMVLGRGGARRFQESSALGFLEQYFLRPKAAVYSKKQDSISVHTAKNPVAEARYAARTIQELIREKGYRYQDIAVITGDMASYGSYVAKAFEEQGIPVFIDETKKLLLNPFIEFVRSALEAAARDFSYESMFRYLRTGLCGLTEQETDRMENYVLAAGIRGAKAWREPWERKTRTLDEEETAYCEELRKRVAEPLIPFAKVVRSRKTTVMEKTQALYRLIEVHAIQQKLAGYEEAFQAEGKLDAAKEYSQIYRIVIHLLEQVAGLLGEERLLLREYTQILEAGFEEAKVGIIPPTADRVVVGDIERTRLKSIKALIFLGLNDGWVPQSADKAGILSELDREALAGSGVELAPGCRENGYIQRFYLYLIMTKPSRMLYLSYSKSRTDGGAMRPSYLVSRIMKMFPDISVEDEDCRENDPACITSAGAGIPYLLEGLKKLPLSEPGAAWKELYSWYFGQEAWRQEIIRLVEAAFSSRDEKGLGREISRALYGSVLENSVSRLEQFAACAFSHFVMYGLALAPREEYVFQPVDMGNIFHRVIEVFSRRVERSPYTWFDLPEDIRDQWAEECVQETAREYGGDILNSSARNAYMVQRMKRIMKRTVWALCEQVKAGQFVPSNYEVSFSRVEGLDAVNIALTAEDRMKLTGRIDRVDTCVDGEKVYVKVIDYKSGNTSFDMVALYYGLQLQLVVYLNAAMEMEKRVHPDKEAVPAGIFYYRMQDPVLDGGKERTPEEINREILKELRLNGLVNEDPEIVKKMDKDAVKDSNVIPVSYNKDGSPSRYASVADGAKFSKLSAYVNGKMRDIGSRILAGETGAVPYERKGRTACDYCQYREVCGFDPKIPGTRYQRLKEYKSEEVWNRIGEEVTEWE